MQYIVLFFGFACIIIFGYFVMRQIDGFLSKNTEPVQVEEPRYLMISVNKTDAEVMEGISAFRKKHNNAVLIVCDDEKSAAELIKKGDLC